MLSDRGEQILARFPGPVTVRPVLTWSMGSTIGVCILLLALGLAGIWLGSTQRGSGFWASVACVVVFAFVGAAMAVNHRTNSMTLDREGFEVVHGGQKPCFCEDLHAHDFDARIMVLSGEITIVRDNKAETFRAGDHCEIAAGCQHTAQVGLEGVAYIVGKVCRRPAVN